MSKTAHTATPATLTRKVIAIAPSLCGGGKSSCGSAEGPGELSPEVWEKVKNHPCYSQEAHHHFARMHVAVAPACNIQCNYCNRKHDCANESRPGVVSRRLTPEQAAARVRAVAAKVPQLSVVGIAGPGDALAIPERTFRTFELIREFAPDIRPCLSTNGLALPDHVERLKALEVDHVTITINAVDPAVAEAIYPWIFFRKRRWKGLDAARILLERQMEGLERLTRAGILCKVNSVMIPGINDEHLIDVNKAVKARGAFLHNIMPLISEPEHGTFFGLNGQRGPSAGELKALQDRCEGGAKLMRHCRQCRADAVGMLGEDRCGDFDVTAAAPVHDTEDQRARRAYQSFVERERRDRAEATQAALAQIAGAPQDLRILVAVASKGSGRINEHFGHAREFQVYEVSRTGATFIGHRRVDHYCKGGEGEDEALDTVTRALADCVAVLVARIGGCPAQGLARAGIVPVQDYAHQYIEASLLAYFKDYWRRTAEGETIATARGDALLRQGAFVA